VSEQPKPRAFRQQIHPAFWTLASSCLSNVGMHRTKISSRCLCGNQAFDEYRVATLRRLEEEQEEFQKFLARLRVAKDKFEFDSSWPNVAASRCTAYVVAKQPSIWTKVPWSEAVRMNFIRKATSD
jgi:hypothetical protein